MHAPALNLPLGRPDILYTYSLDLMASNPWRMGSAAPRAGGIAQLAAECSIVEHERWLEAALQRVRFTSEKARAAKSGWTRQSRQPTRRATLLR